MPKFDRIAKMSHERRFPDDPLMFIRRCIEQGKIFWTYHVNMRLKGRSISRETIISSRNSFEIIEKYPEDRYFPSYLLFSVYRGEIFHVLCATDVEGDNIRIITAYRPNPEEWEADLKTRRR